MEQAKNDSSRRPADYSIGILKLCCWDIAVAHLRHWAHYPSLKWHLCHQASQNQLMVQVLLEVLCTTPSGRLGGRERLELPTGE